jgi:hypothetical protein
LDLGSGEPFDDLHWSSTLGTAIKIPRVFEDKPESLRVRMRDTRRFVETNLGNLRELLSGEARMARAELTKHIRRIVLTREGKTYVAAGGWSLLGLGCYDGAGGPAGTMISGL